MSLDNTCEVCGWLAAAASAVGFGSFGVPIKGAPVALDPLVFQSYKTTICFVTSWLVLLLGDDYFVYSPWGIVSGLFWVPGGVATVYAIQAAGLGIAIGIGSSFIVLVSFTWGIFVFQEQVHSRLAASFAILCMMLGLLGMSYYSSPESASFDAILAAVEDDELELEVTHKSGDAADETQRCSLNVGMANIRQRTDAIKYQGLVATRDDDHETHTKNRFNASEYLSNEMSDEADDQDESQADCIMLDAPQEQPEVIVVFGRKMLKRHVGMLSAVFTGCYGGSIMAPMQYAPANAKGTHFLISFAIGSALVNIWLWLLRYLFYCRTTRCPYAAYEKLPPFHIRDMWKPGVACGLLCT
ncbi:hypothetical protein MPSEU_000836400 [Mayamaea pseudoterrestris]|nr:hypothetical protein MPSEU_000836400 [Mayamaea pseudoterrestris]